MVNFCPGLMGIHLGQHFVLVSFHFYLPFFPVGFHFCHHLGLELSQDGYQVVHHLLRHLFHFCRLAMQQSTAVFSP
jgi:hypothetical protein